MASELGFALSKTALVFLKILDKFQNDNLIFFAVDCVFMYVQRSLDKIAGLKLVSARSVLQKHLTLPLQEHATHNTALLPAVSQNLNLFQAVREKTALQPDGSSLLQPLGERRPQSRRCPARRFEGLPLLHVAVPVSTKSLTDSNRIVCPFPVKRSLELLSCPPV